MSLLLKAGGRFAGLVNPECLAPTGCRRVTSAKPGLGASCRAPIRAAASSSAASLNAEWQQDNPTVRTKLPGVADDPMGSYTMDPYVPPKDGSANAALWNLLKVATIATALSHSILNNMPVVTAAIVGGILWSTLGQGATASFAAMKGVILVALAWAGSQATRTPRLLWAVILTAVIASGLTWLEDESRLVTKSGNLGLAAAFFFGLAFIITGVLLV